MLHDCMCNILFNKDFFCVKIAAKCNHNFENICYYCILENAEKKTLDDLFSERSSQSML